MKRSVKILAHPSVGMPQIEDVGRTMNAPEVAQFICEGRHSARWVIEHMGPSIGSKPGREWYFREKEARRWWEDYLNRGRNPARLAI